MAKKKLLVTIRFSRYYIYISQSKLSICNEYKQKNTAFIQHEHVMEPPGSLAGTLDEDEDGHSGPAGRRASKRKVKPNKNVYGPEWSNQ
jgi:hypothetical protein